MHQRTPNSSLAIASLPVSIEAYSLVRGVYFGTELHQHWPRTNTCNGPYVQCNRFVVYFLHSFPYTGPQKSDAKLGMLRMQLLPWFCWPCWPSCRLTDTPSVHQYVKNCISFYFYNGRAVAISVVGRSRPAAAYPFWSTVYGTKWYKVHLWLVFDFHSVDVSWRNQAFICWNIYVQYFGRLQSTC